MCRAVYKMMHCLITKEQIFSTHMVLPDPTGTWRRDCSCQRVDDFFFLIKGSKLFLNWRHDWCSASLLANAGVTGVQGRPSHFTSCLQIAGGISGRDLVLRDQQKAITWQWNEHPPKTTLLFSISNSEKAWEGLSFIGRLGGC